MPNGNCTAPIYGHRSPLAAASCPLHGTSALSSQRSGTRAAAGWPPSRSLPTAPTPAFTNYNHQYGKIGDLSEKVIALLLEKSEDRARAAAFELMDAIRPPGKPAPRNGHWLCVLFEEFAVGVQRLIDTPNMLIDQLVGDMVRGEEVIASAVRALLKHAVQLALENQLAPLRVLHLQACVCAVAFCPDPGKHSSLEKNCVIPLAKAAPIRGETQTT